MTGLITRHTIFVLTLFFCSALSAETPVSVYTIENRLHKESILSSANVVSIEKTTLSSDIDGRITELFFEAGDYVEKGSLLVKLDSAVQELELARAKANLDRLQANLKLATLELDRVAKLLPSGAISKELFDQAQASAERAQAESIAQSNDIDIAINQLAKHQILAPFSGYLIHRHVSRGAWLNSGSSIGTLISTNPLRLTIKTPQRYYTTLRDAHRNGALEVIIDSGLEGTGSNSQTKKLPVDRIIANADASRQFEVWAKIENPVNNWLPGTAIDVRLEWPLTTSQDEYVIPLDALTLDSNAQQSIWRVSQATLDEQGSRWIVDPVGVEVLSRSKGFALVKTVDANNILLGEKIVLTGNESLKPGQAVSVSP